MTATRRGWRIRPRPADPQDLTEDERWLLRFDKKVRAYESGVHPVVWRSLLASRFERDGAWADDAPLTRESVLALTLRVQEWLVAEPASVQSASARRILGEVQRLVAGADLTRNEIMRVLDAALKEEPEDRVRFVRLNLRRKVGAHSTKVSDEMIVAALTGWVEANAGEVAQPKWKPVVALLKAVGIDDVDVKTISRRWRAFKSKRKKTPPAR